MDGDISALLKQVMENPQFGAMVDSMKGQLGGDGGTLDLSGVMDKLPTLMNVLGPMMGQMGQNPASDATKEEAVPAASVENEPPAEAVATSAVPQNPIGLGNGPFFKPGSRDKRNKLLAALKPYLSPARCSLVDRAMSAMQLGELLGTVMPGEVPGKG